MRRHGERSPVTEADLVGYWRITSMEMWKADYVDLVVPGFIEFELEESRLMGQFQFGTVAGWLDCRLREIGGDAYVEWSWEGRNDNDPGCGRGWATVRNETLVGRLFIHCGDDSAFEAEKQVRPGRQRVRRKAPKQG
jgi:hypothetical protein